MKTSEEWRAECEARHVCNIKTKHDRLLYLAGVENERGKKAAEKLRKDVIYQWGLLTKGKK